MRGETAETPRLLLGIVGGEAFAARQRNEVSAGAEALVARAGDDDHADFGIVLRLLQRGADASMDRCVDRVARLGPVDRYDQQVILALGDGGGGVGRSNLPLLQYYPGGFPFWLTGRAYPAEIG